METVYWVWLTRVLGFSGAMTRVYHRFTPREAYFATKEELKASGIKEKDIELLQDKNLDEAKRIVDKCERLGIKIVTALSDEYPKRLERLKNKPLVLYVKGSLDCLKKKTAAVIGTRDTTIMGEEKAREISQGLLLEGYTLISGVAEGIDSIGARESLDKSIPFCVVSGVDIDKYYPASSEKMIDKIAENGVVISEYPPDTNARFFPARNRIIAGLSDEVYVIEAPERSGALITAKEARSIGVKVYAGLGEGCRALIENGASPLEPEKKKDKKIPQLTGIRLYIY